MTHAIRSSRLARGLALIVLLMLPSGAVAADQTKTDRVIDAFVKACRENPKFDQPQREAALEVVAALRGDEFARDAAVAQGLRKLYPQFAAALAALAAEDTDRAVKALAPLAASDDSFLAAESAYYLARAHVGQECYEQAMPYLESLLKRLAESTTRGGEGLFLQGVCQSRTLNRAAAIKSLHAYLEAEPDAPQRMRVGAWRMIELLEQTAEGSLGDVQDHMEYSRRRLSLELTDKTTEKAQGDIIAMLNKLIEEAEQQESQGQSSGEGKQKQQGEGEGDGQGQGRGGQGGSRANDQSPTKQVRRLNRVERSPWDHLRAKQRGDKALSALKAKFPARYQRLVEQYYRSLQEDEPR